MPVTGTCPNCGQKAPLEHFVIEEKYKKAMIEALRTPASLADLLLPYLGLFSPATGRAIRADKLARLVTEFRQLVDGTQVTRNRVTYAAPLELWRMGIEQTLAARDTGTLSLPLDNHHYLSEIVWRLASKAANKPAAPKVSHPSHRAFESDNSQADQRQRICEQIGTLENLIARSNGDTTALEAQLSGYQQQLEALNGSV